MEFLEHDIIADDLALQSAAETKRGETFRYALKDEEGVSRRLVIGVGMADDGADAHACDRDRLAEFAGEVLARLHFAEVVAVPVTTWRDVLDIASFDLAENEEWADIDAEAAIHVATRDPLSILPPDRPLARALFEAVLRHADEPKHDLSVVALDAPFVMEVRHNGSLWIQCANETAADTILGIFESL